MSRVFSETRRGRRAPGGSWLLVALALAAPVVGQDGKDLDLEAMFREGIPDSPFVNVVYRYADTLLLHGRDLRGPLKSGLFLSALDRKSLAPLTVRPPAPAGLPPEHRPGPAVGPLTGANPQLDQNLLRLLYFLKGLSGEDRYPRAADQALEWFLKNTQSPSTGLYPWGEHLSWNVATGEVASGLPEPVHEFHRPWLLWDKCFELAPKESERFARALLPARRARESARQAGFVLRTWAEAYAHTRDVFFVEAMDGLLEHHEVERGTVSFRASSLVSLAIDCDGAAGKVPEPLRTRLARFASRQDDRFCSLPHDPQDKKGFVVSAPVDAGRQEVAYTPLWQAVYGRDTTARVAVMCVSRYENTGRIEYRDLIVAAANAYLDSLPGDGTDAWPGTFGHAITLELAAFRVTAREKYYRRAFRLGEIAVERFFGQSPLPRASLETDHYESTTGADTLVLALTELHLTARHITAVRAPANTIDR